MAATNGKGSTCAMLEAILAHAGYRTGVFTSPHLVHFEERLRLQGAPVAADLLKVSRPFLIKLLEEQKIPFTKTGRHRRVRAVDLFAYKAERDHQRSEALSDMAALDAAHGLL